MPGRHHALNALAAIVVGAELGIPFETSAEALRGFSGIHRRFEVIGEVGGVTVIDDYGHHPTEIMATIRAAREGFARRLIVVFQPHRFTRTRDLFPAFVHAFDAADILVLTDIYPAGEQAIEGVTSEALYAAIRRDGQVDTRFVPERAAVAGVVGGMIQPGDLVLVLGAGDIVRSARELCGLLEDHQSASAGLV
jgi:UDP-N-acetylmuramate--alanine ligase